MYKNTSARKKAIITFNTNPPEIARRNGNVKNQHHIHHSFLNIITNLFVSLFLFLATVPSVQSETCNLCPNATHVPLDGSASFLLVSSGQFINCTYAAEVAPEGFFANCTALHSIGAGLCDCGDPNIVEEPFQCPLCGEGNTLPFPNRTIANKTCQEWEDRATKYPFDCPSTQKSFGPYCGCDIASDPNYFDGYCRICDDAQLPDPNRTVLVDRTINNVLSSSTEFCVELEQGLNMNHNLNCSQTQISFGADRACNCKNVNGNPTKAPSGSSDPGDGDDPNSGKTIRIGYHVYTFASSLLLFLFAL